MLCDLPVRFDTYAGCGHGCAYCFAGIKRNLADVRPAESVTALRRWIDGHRSQETAWCDWRLPLHFGGCSDPLQPIEREQRRTLACLEVLADTQYPFVLSTKSTLAIEPPWRDALVRCNVVVQVSMVSPAFDAQEPGAPPFAARLRMLRRLVPLVRRVIVRVQPYTPDVLADVLRALPRYAAAGVHGVTIEGMKYKRAGAGLVKVGADWCYPIETLRPDFLRIRTRCHTLGLRFYCAENRLRALSDDRCCCGVDGLSGFRPNRANLNSPAAGRPLRYRRRMRRPGTAACFKSICQNAASTPALRSLSYADAMNIAARVPAYRTALGIGRPRPVASRSRRPQASAAAPASVAARRATAGRPAGLRPRFVAVPSGLRSIVEPSPGNPAGGSAQPHPPTALRNRSRSAPRRRQPPAVNAASGMRHIFLAA